MRLGATALAVTLIAVPALAHDPGSYTRADIRRAQETLDGLGYRVGGVDGRLGRQTRTAIRNFQRDKNLNATGELDRETLAALEDRAAAGEETHVRDHTDTPRRSAASVRRAQDRLSRLGYPVGAADGVLGTETRTAIRNFQRDKNLNATGELTDETLSALEEDSGSATSGTR